MVMETIKLRIMMVVYFCLYSKTVSYTHSVNCMLWELYLNETTIKKNKTFGEELKIGKKFFEKFSNKKEFNGARIRWNNMVRGSFGFFFYLFTFLNKEAQLGEKGARNLWRMFRCWKEHVRQFNKDNGFMTNILLENLVNSN